MAKKKKITLSLKAARVNKGLTRAEAAKQLGISESTLGAYERGEVEPRAIVFQKMLILYELDADQIEFSPELIEKKKDSSSRKGRSRRKKQDTAKSSGK